MCPRIRPEPLNGQCVPMMCVVRCFSADSHNRALLHRHVHLQRQALSQPGGPRAFNPPTTRVVPLNPLSAEVDRDQSVVTQEASRAASLEEVARDVSRRTRGCICAQRRCGIRTDQPCQRGVLRSDACFVCRFSRSATTTRGAASARLPPSPSGSSSTNIRTRRAPRRGIGAGCLASPSRRTGSSS